MSRIQIFKPAKSLASMEGVSVSLSAADLQDIAAGYNAAVHEAPLTIGHPAHDAPAYGWVKALSFADGALQADCEESPELGELVSKGQYKKVSASFYTPQAPSNPTPGKWSLRHVGFLGAQPPAVKGLKAVSFAEAEEGVVTFGELPGFAGNYIARLFGGLRDWLIAKEGQEVADRVISSWDVESLRSISQRADEAATDNQFSGGTPALSFSEPGNAATSTASITPTDQTQEQSSMKTAEQLQAELDAANTQLQSLQTAEAQRCADARHASHVSFAEGLVTAAKWPSDAKDVLVATLDHLAQPTGTQATGIVSFGEGDAAKPLATALQEQLQAMPASVSFGEFAKDGKGQTPASNQQVAARAKAHQERLQASGQNISISQAIDAVNAGADKA
jgi:hypothetical protein